MAEKKEPRTRAKSSASTASATAASAEAAAASRGGARASRQRAGAGGHRRPVAQGRRRPFCREAHRRRARLHRGGLLHRRARSAARGARLAGGECDADLRGRDASLGKRRVDRRVHAARARALPLHGHGLGRSLRVLAQGTRAARGPCRHSRRFAGGQRAHLRDRGARGRRRRAGPEELGRALARERDSRNRPWTRPPSRRLRSIPSAPA